MATKTPKAPTVRLRDLHPEKRREVQRSQAVIAAERVKISDAKARIEEHRGNIKQLKGE